MARWAAASGRSSSVPYSPMTSSAVHRSGAEVDARDSRHTGRASSVQCRASRSRPAARMFGSSGDERRVAGCAHLWRRGGAAKSGQRGGRRLAAALGQVAGGRRSRRHPPGPAASKPATRRVRRHGPDDEAPTRMLSAGTSSASPARRAKRTRSEAASTSSSARASSPETAASISRASAPGVLKATQLTANRHAAASAIANALRRLRRGRGIGRGAPVQPAARLGADTARRCR